MRGGAELLGGSHVIISMQAAAISMQMPRSGPGGAVVHNAPGQGSTHRLFALLITALVPCNSQHSADTGPRHCASVGAEG